jgi:hypothetical protein
MGLLQNISLKNAEPYKRLGDTSEMQVQILVRSRNRYCNDNYSKYYGVPIGYGSPYAWILPISAGGMACINGILGISEINYANLAGVKRATSNIAGTSYIGVANKVNIQATAKLTSDIVGLATINADIAALVNMVAELNGAANVSAALGGISLAICSILGNGSVNADITANALISSNINGSSTFDSDIIASMYITATILANSILQGDIKADAFMSSDIFVGAKEEILSPTSLATAVWNALAAEFNNPGTLGNKLNSAASAGDPWITDLPGSYTGDSAGKKISEIERLAKIIKNLTVSGL